MADNRKYYYLKLKENFFDSDSIVLLEDMKDGILYSNILLKLYLKSLKNGGRLQLDEHIPYTAQMIATLTRHQIGTVERALAIFQQLGLVEQLDCGLLYMTDIELMIGQSSTEAERKRAARLENKALLPPRTNGGHLSDIRPPEIEIKKEIDIELEKEEELKGQALARSYGRCVAIYAVLVAGIQYSDNLSSSLFGVMAYTVILCYSLFKTASLSKSIFNAH
ncbi:MAG: phage replisome organizer N-terminal domain-containing protein [Roseburia hominis]